MTQALTFRVIPALMVLGLLGMAHSVEAETFMDVELSPPAVDYVVLRDVNVRERPETKSKRLDGLKKGERVRSPGRFEGWAAVLRDGNPLGFAYRKYLLPVLDGSLKRAISGKMTVSEDGSCDYTISFQGRSTANAVLFEMADYETELACSINGDLIKTTLYMFLTEGPMAPSKPTQHQIGMDLLEISIGDSYDEVFTTNVIYDHDKQTIEFDGLSFLELLGKPAETEREAKTVPAALAGAVEIALQSWNAKTWQMLLAAQN